MSKRVNLAGQQFGRWTVMGPRPKGKTLERKDNNLGYSPDNCTWATPAEQAQNRAPMRRRYR